MTLLLLKYLRLFAQGKPTLLISSCLLFLGIAATSSLCHANAQAVNTHYPEHQSTTFQTGDTVHIVENIPSIKALAWDALFWTSLNLTPDIISYAALQIFIHRNPSRDIRALQASGIQPLLTSAKIARSAVKAYKFAKLGEFIWTQTTPAIRQLYRRKNCSRKTGELPVYIADKTLARAFAIKIRFGDQEGVSVAFHALKPVSGEIRSHLPPAWQQLFQQILKLPDSTLHVNIRTTEKHSEVCLSKNSGHHCDRLLSFPLPPQEEHPANWDMEMAGQWCSQSTLASPESGYSIFSTSVINAIANTLSSAPSLLPPQHPVGIVWQGNSAVLDSATGFDYQVGWSDSALNPASPGFVILASHEHLRLTPENLDYVFSNWKHWFDSYQKHWSGTPIQWLTTLLTNQITVKARRHIYSSSKELISGTSTHGTEQTPTSDSNNEITTSVSTPDSTDKPPSSTREILRYRDGQTSSTFVPEQEIILPSSPLITGHTDSAIDIPPDNPAPPYTNTDKANILTYRPDYSPWQTPEKSQILVARTIALHLGDDERDSGTYRSESEFDYLLSSHPGPKPTTLILHGVPTRLHELNFELILLLSIDKNQVLTSYKENAGTKANDDLDQYKTKRHPGLSSLAHKLYEMDLRRYPLLKPHSWGHIGEDGKPKPKTNPTKYYTPTLIENEVILRSYDTSNIKGIIITENTPLLLQNVFFEPLATILELKSKFEQTVGLKTLPVFFYNQRLGQIVGSLTLDHDQFKDLQTRISGLRNKHPCFGANAHQLPAFFESWPFDKYLELLESHAADQEIQFPDQLSEAVDHSLDKKFVKTIVSGKFDSTFFEWLIEHPAFLLAPRSIPFDTDRLAGTAESKLPLTPVQVIAFPLQVQLSTSPLGTYRERAKLADNVIDQAGISAAFSYRPITTVHLLGNPYAAFNWIAKRGCPISDSGTQYIKQAALILSGVVNQPDDQTQLFDQVIHPLFKELLTKGKINKQALNSLISNIEESLSHNLSIYITDGLKTGIFDSDITSNEYINIVLSQYEKPRASYDPDLTPHKIRQDYYILVLASHFYMATYGELSLQQKTMIAIFDECLFSLSPYKIDTCLKNIPAQVFYPAKKMILESSPRPDQEILVILKEAFKESYNRPKTMLEVSHSLSTVLSSKIALYNIASRPTDTSLFSIITAPWPEQSELKETVPTQQIPKGLSQDIELAKTYPLPLKHSMSDHLNRQLQQVINHYYQTPNPVDLHNIITGKRFYDRDTLWRQHHGVDHVVRTIVILEATIQLHKAFSQKYADLFNNHPDLERLLFLAVAYHDVVAETLDKELEESVASEILMQDLSGTDISPTTLKLVISALKNKNVDTLDPVPEGYTPDALASADEILIRRLIRIPDSADIARVKTVSDLISFTLPSELDEATLSDNYYSVKWMNLDPELLGNNDFMTEWFALMKTAVFWASQTGASPHTLNHPNPAELMPYTVSPSLETWTHEISLQRKLVISRSPHSLAYVRNILHDITRLFIAQEAGKTVVTLFQLRQITLPENWSTLDSFLHFTDKRREKLQPVIDTWTGKEFTPHHGTLTKKLLSDEGFDKLPPYLLLEKVKRQRGYDSDTKQPVYEDAWELSLKD